MDFVKVGDVFVGKGRHCIWNISSALQTNIFLLFQDWDLVEITQKYLKMLLQYLVNGEWSEIVCQGVCNRVK